MNLLVAVFWICSLLILGRIAYAIHYLPKVAKHYRSKTHDSTELESSIALYLLVPLLNESTIFGDLSARLEETIKNVKNVKIVFVTTEREYISSKKSFPTDTIALVKKFLEQKRNSRFLHIHYPFVNKVVAEQLNYALKSLTESGLVLNKTFFGFLNADAHFSERILKKVQNTILHSPNTTVFQLSSLFFANKDNLIGPAGLLLRANALRQTRWTLLYEVPRYLRNFPRVFNLQHVVTNGLYIRGDTFKSIGFFPTDSYGEDLYLGFILHAAGYKIDSVPILDNSESPSSIRSMLRQKFVWFWGPYGYMYYWLRIRKRFPVLWSRNRSVILGTTIAGILDAMNWMFAGTVYIFYIFISFVLGLYIGIFATTLVILYLVGTLTAVLHIYNSRAEEQKFSIVTFREAIICICLYPLVLVLHGLPPWYTIGKDLLLRTTKEVYLRPKTERI